MVFCDALFFWEAFYAEFCEFLADGCLGESYYVGVASGDF